MADIWLIKAVKESLEQNLLRNATFIGERLYASYPTEVREFDARSASAAHLRPAHKPCNASQANAHLLGTCYFRSTQFHRVVEILQGENAGPCAAPERTSSLRLKHPLRAGAASPANRLLLGQAHYELRRYAEAEAAVCPDGDRTEARTEGCSSIPFNSSVGQRLPSEPRSLCS